MPERVRRLGLSAGLVLALVLPATAAADSGSVVVSDAGNGWMSAKVKLTSTGCNQTGGCHWLGYMTERHATLPCATDDSTFIRGVQENVWEAGSREAIWSFRPFFPRQARLCLYLKNAASPDEKIVADVTYPVPNGYGMQRSSRYWCTDFGSQSAAQYYLYLYPGDPSHLAYDGGGVACPDMWCPCGADRIPPEPEAAPTPIVLPPATPPSPGCDSARESRRQASRAVETAKRKVRINSGWNPRQAQRWRLRLRKAKGSLKRAEAHEATVCG